MQIINYFEGVAADFTLEPAQAMAHFAAKGLKPTFAWQDMLGDEHDAAFTVAKMMNIDLLNTVKTKLQQALDDGATLDDFKKALIPTLQKAGWWGKQDVIDPLTGTVINAQLGSASRLETIFRTNLQSAYSVGHWQQIADQADSAPYLLYDAVDDHRTRTEHRDLDGIVLPISDPFWRQYYPPNGWNCRCGAIQMDANDLKAANLKVTKPPPNFGTYDWINPRTDITETVPRKLSPGWNHNPGLARQQHLTTLAAQKAAQLAREEKDALAQAAARHKNQAAEQKAALIRAASKEIAEQLANKKRSPPPDDD